MNRLILAAALLLFTAVPAFANEPDATLYELTENMFIIGNHRVATAALGGFARRNTPLCPPRLAPRGERCIINGTGSNDISLITGRGPISGSFTTVTQDTNPIDISEVVRQTGDFAGRMDLSLASEKFLGTMRGVVVDGEQQRHRFVGVVRFPVPCPETRIDFCYVASGPDAFPTGLQPLRRHEFALGRPMVRLDVYFDE